MRRVFGRFMNGPLARPPAASDIDRALTFIAQVEKAMEDREPDAAQAAPVRLAEFLQGAALHRTNLFT